jgi:hypothetical protein
MKKIRFLLASLAIMAIVKNQISSQPIIEKTSIYCEINSVVTFGFSDNHIIYSQEGLLMYCSPCYNNNYHCQFIPLEQLDKEKTAQLQCFLQDNDFFSYCTYYGLGYIVLDPTSYGIIIRQNNSFKSIFLGNCYHSKLDSLVYYVNSIIPELYKEYYSISRYNDKVGTCICEDTIIKNRRSKYKK